MHNRLSIFSSKNRDPFSAIVLFMACVVLVEASLSFLPQNSLVRSFRVNRVPDGPAADIQIMGDSVARGGIIADQLALGLSRNETVYNHALAGTGPEFPYFVLKRELEAGKAPKALLYAPAPHTFGSLRVALLVGAFCDWREIGEIIAAGIQPFEVLYGVLCKVSYTLRHREQISELLKGRQEQASKPAKRSTKVITTKRDIPAEKLHPMYQKGFSVEKFNQVYFEKFLALARQHNIKVYWATMPVLSAVYENRKQFHFDAAYYQFLDDVGLRYGVQFLQKEFVIFDAEDFKDHIHLNEAAARRFTKMLEPKLSTAENPTRASAMNVPEH